MPEELSLESKEAVHKARGAAQAIELAREVALAKAVEETAVRTKESLLEGLREVFELGNPKESEEMRVLWSRVPILCTHFEQVQNDITAIKSMFRDNTSDHETRLRAIEKNVWKWMGVLMIAPPIVTIGIAWLISIIVHH